MIEASTMKLKSLSYSLGVSAEALSIGSGSRLLEDCRTAVSLREKAEEELEKLLAEALIRLPETQKEIEASSFRVTVTLKTEWPLPGLAVLPADLGSLQIEASKEALVRDAPAFIRGMRKLARIGEGG